MDYISELKKRILLLKKNPSPLYHDTKNTLNSLLLIVNNIDKNLATKILQVLESNNFKAAVLDELISDLYISLVSQDNKSNLSVLNFPVDKIKGVGEKLKANLHSINIKTVNDLLLFFPNKYEYVSSNNFGKKILTGKYFSHEYVKTKFGKNYLFVIFQGENGEHFSGVWFNYSKKYPIPFLQSSNKLSLYGEVKNFRGLESIVHPEFIDTTEIDKIRVKYPVGTKIKNKIFCNLVKNTYESYFEYLYESLPEYILRKYGFPEIKQALKGIHFPAEPENVNELNLFQSIYHKRFIFEELFYLQLGFAVKKHNYQKNKGIEFKIERSFLERIKPFVPFKLTNAQRNVLRDIFNDMKSQIQMNRLIQGDVGSGKTIVSFIAALVAILNGYQVAVIAPTEILAEQHFNNFNKLINNNFTSALLTSAVKKSEKENIKNFIKNHEIDFVFGTHAIIQEDVVFNKLGLAIIDEQHRFGVLQRKALSDKGLNPDILLMSATPIPRTLALTLYGDLDISIIDELPPGRKTIITKALSEHKTDVAVHAIKAELNKGNQAYVVYPLIEESEVMDLKAATIGYEKFSKIFGVKNVGLLHGKMKSLEKKEIMDRFKNKEIKVLISTTVIEVGVDVPDATIMVIENAERFGIAQLHQLRGRIGRSDKQSYCFLIYSEKVNDEGLKRIRAMEQYNDGFRLAEIDLEMRGPGDFYGVRQSGLPSFKFSNIIRDAKILVEARKEALEIIQNDPYLEKPENNILRQVLKEKWKKEIELIQIG